MIIRHLSNDNTKSHFYLFLLFFPTNVLISHLIKFLFSFMLKTTKNYAAVYLEQSRQEEYINGRCF